MQNNEVRNARRRGRTMLAQLPRATNAYYDMRLRRIIVTLTSGLDIAIAPELVEILRSASDEQLNSVEVTPPGFELYFSALDDGLWLPSLMEGSFETQRWMREQKSVEVSEASPADVAA